MHFSKTTRLFACISSMAAALLGAGSAFARPEVPGQLQKAADMVCVPLCTMCHATNPGQATNWLSTLGNELHADILAERDITASYLAWTKKPTTTADMVAYVKAGYKPDTLLTPGAAPINVCGPVYGCALPPAKQALAPKSDFTGVLWVGGAVVVGGLLRRRKKAR